MQSSNNFYQLVADHRQAIDWINQILKGGENDTVEMDGVLKPSITKDIADRWTAISAMVQGRAAYQTKSALPSVPPEGVVLAEVWADPDKENNGLYGWGGSSWEKSPFDTIQDLMEQKAEVSALQETLRDQGISGLANRFPNGHLEPLANGLNLVDGTELYNQQPQDEFSEIPNTAVAQVLSPMGLNWALRMKRSASNTTNRHFVHTAPAAASGRYVLASFLCFSDDPNGDGINPTRNASFYVSKNGVLGDGSNGITDKVRGMEYLGSGVWLKWQRFRAFEFGPGQSAESMEIWIGDTDLGSADYDAWITGINYAISDKPISYAATSWNSFQALGIYSRIENTEKKVSDIHATKAEIEIPGIETFSNAVTNRVATKHVTPSKHLKPLYKEELATRVVNFPYDKVAHEVFGEPNAMQVSSIDDLIYTPTTCYKVYPDDLARLGIIPDDVNPPTVDMRAAVRLDNPGTDNDEVQVFFLLQYSASSDLTETYAPNHENVLFVNGSGAVSLDYLGGGDSFWQHTVNATPKTGDYIAYGHNRVKIPKTYGGKPFRGIKILALGKKPADYVPGTRRYLTTFGLAVTKSSESDIALSGPYWNKPEDSFGYVSHQDLLQLNQEMASKVSGEVEPIWMNAVRGRFGVGEVEHDNWDGGSSTLFYEADEKIRLETGERNVIKGVSSKAQSYYPKIGHRLDLDDLARIGLVPDDNEPPLISMRAAWTKSLLTQHDSSRVQIFFILRYGGSDSVLYDSSTDVLFNTDTGTASWIGFGDASWDHQVNVVENDYEVIYAHHGIPLRRTYNGQPLTAVIINGLGFPLQDESGEVIPQGEWQLGMHKFAVVAGSMVQPDLLYLNTPDDSPKVGGIEKQQLSDDLKSALLWKDDGHGDARHVVTIQSSDKITLLGDSYSASHYTQKDKAYISRLAELVDWRFENFARSGDDYSEINQRILNGTCEYHPSISFKDYGSTYGLMISFTNDTYHRSADTLYFRDNMRRLAETVKACGVEPIISTEFVAGSWHDIASVGAVAREAGYRFFDIASPARTFDVSRFSQYWGGGHPAVRTNGLFVDSLLDHIGSLPRPNQGIKLYRKRLGWPGNDESLLYDTIEQRVFRWQEISMGHHALTDNLAPYYDRLDDIKNEQGGYRYQSVTSEYLKLQNREMVDMGTHLLAEVIVPSTAARMSMANLQISDTEARVFVRRVMRPLSWNGYNKRRAYVVDDGVSVSPGDTYIHQSDGAMVTVVGMATDWDGKRLLLTASYKDTGYSSGGTLERNSGDGSLTITYSTARYGFDPDYYHDIGQPRGEWLELENDGGSVLLKDRNMLQQAMSYDKLIFMVTNPLGVQLNDISLEWYGTAGKDASVKPSWQPSSQQSQILPVTTMDDLTGWQIIGVLAPSDPHDSVLPKGTSKMVTVSDNNRLRQSFSLPAAGRYARTADVVVWTRRYPAHFSPSSNQEAAAIEYLDSAPINSQTCDYRTLEIKLDSGGQDHQSLKLSKLVGLHWSEHRFRIDLPADGLHTDTLNLELYSPDGELEIALVEVYV